MNGREAGVIEKATTASPSARSRWIPTFAVAAAIAVLLLLGMAVTPYLFQGATLESEMSTQVRSTTGLVLTHRGSRAVRPAAAPACR